MEICTQRVRFDRDDVGGRETTPETPRFPRPISPFESKDDAHPPAPPAASNNDTGLEPPPPLPSSDNLGGRDLPDPVLGSTASHPSQSFLRNDEEDPLPDSDEDLPPSGYANEDPPGMDPNSDNDSPPPDSDDDPPPSDPEDDEDDPTITLENMKTDLKFIKMVEKSTLESQFNAAELHAFWNPHENQTSPSDDPDLWLSISFYISSLDHTQSQKGYAEWRELIQQRFPELKMLLYDQVKRQVSDLSGVITWKHHVFRLLRWLYWTLRRPGRVSSLSQASL